MPRCYTRKSGYTGIRGLARTYALATKKPCFQGLLGMFFSVLGQVNAEFARDGRIGIFRHRHYTPYINGLGHILYLSLTLGRLYCFLATAWRHTPGVPNTGSEFHLIAKSILHPCGA